MSIAVSAFYKFVEIENLTELRRHLLEQSRWLGIKGTILLAPEGINATISGEAQSLRELLSWLRSDLRFADLETKESEAPQHPFQRLKVKIKSEIVTFHQPQANPARMMGTEVPPAEWNSLVQEPGVILIDTRNSYEVEIGSFKGAIDPRTRAFHQFPEFVRTHLDPGESRKIAMFCTGGIRCEKASSYLLSQGFAQVYQLKGGILKYLETVPKEESLWQGECFVFDERVAVRHGLAIGSHCLCSGCGRPILSEAAAPASANCPSCRSRLEPEVRQADGLLRAED
jgi:UPF0176 protein